MKLIDFGVFVDGSPANRKATAVEVFHAFQNSGFLYLQNHGIPEETVSQVFQMSANFFKRPQDQKDSLSWTTPDANRGYVKAGNYHPSMLH